MPGLTALEACYDGPIPRAALDFALSGRSAGDFALMQAQARAAGSRLFVEGQIRAIRQRRADGSFYPAMLDDFHAYWRSYRDAMHVVAERRSTVMAKPERPAIAAE
jgi:hypothetical protein